MPCARAEHDYSDGKPEVASRECEPHRPSPRPSRSAWPHFPAPRPGASRRRYVSSARQYPRLRERGRSGDSSLNRRQASQFRHLFAVGSGSETREITRGFPGILRNATRHDQTGGETFEVPLKWSRQRLVEIVDVEDRRSFRCRVGTEICQVCIATGLQSNARRRGVGEIRRHHGGRAAQEREWIGAHPCIANWQQFLDSTFALFNQKIGGVGSLRGSGPLALCASRHLLPERHSGPLALARAVRRYHFGPPATLVCMT
jgi:hypothetical protein